MTGHKSVIELLADQLAEALERIEVLEKELERLYENTKAIRAVLGPKQ